MNQIIQEREENEEES